MSKKRSLSTEEARWVRQKGYHDALEFALAIGLSEDYKNDFKAKKDVIDLSGDAHSVKGGEKKWQIFLYSLTRFEEDESFVAMNGIGALLAECINSFPNTFEEYQRNKVEAKERLRTPMKKLAEKLQGRSLLKAFLNKSLFNGGEVNYLTVKQNGGFHIFLNRDVIELLGKHLEVTNSRARSIGQISEQKVLFRYKGVNLAELEMRNDSEIHYREMRFNMIKPKAMDLLSTILITGKWGNKVFIHGNAVRSFGRWKKK